MADKKKLERIAQRIYLLICDMAEIGEDYTLLQREYNELIEACDLPLKRIRWISNTEFEEME